MARKVSARAQALSVEAAIASRMASLEKKPDKKGVPVKARLPRVKHPQVKGASRCIPPIFRMSCSSFRQ